MIRITSALEDVDGSDLAFTVGLAVLLVFIVIFLTGLISKLLVICAPSEIMIFSGRSHRLGDGTITGFKVLHGGRRFRIPLLESVTSMDVRLFSVQVSVTNAFSKGGIPLSVHAIANVKISSEAPLVRQAVERFLGVAPVQVSAVARQTLEGVLREVLSQLTPEEVNEDRLKFAETLVQNAKDDLDKLGLKLDVLKVQQISDDQKYLTNLGRAQIASMLRDAENAENQSAQAVSEAEAIARQRAGSAAQQAEALVLQKQNMYRTEIAKLEAEAKSIENEAAVAHETARSMTEQELQTLRGELAKLFLQVEMVLPAEAAARANAARARGDAAPVREQGRAAATALGFVADEWVAAGSLGREVFILQQLDQIVTSAIERVAKMHVASLEVLDGGDAESIGTALGGFAIGVRRVLEEMGHTMGIDLPGLIRASGASPELLAPKISVGVMEGKQ